MQNHMLIRTARLTPSLRSLVPQTRPLLSRLTLALALQSSFVHQHQHHIRKLSSASMETNITLYSVTTPNGVKVSITLEELGLKYKVYAIDMMKNEQKEDWFVKINPNGRIPAITVGDQRLFESGAIMLFLVDKYDKDHKFSYEFGTTEYYEMMSWLMFQMGGVGPMQGQLHHFMVLAKANSVYGINRFTDEVKRLYGILDKRLQESEYLAGDKYTIADIAHFCWVRVAFWCDVDIAEFPALKKWSDKIGQREAVKKGLLIPESSFTEEQKTAWFEDMKNKIKAMDNTDKH